MKKLIGVAMLSATLLGLGGCGNRQFFDTTWDFNQAIIITGDEIREVSVQSWRDFDGSDMIQIRTADGVTYLTHSSNVILVQN